MTDLKERCENLAKTLDVHETNLERACWKIEAFAREIRNETVDAALDCFERPTPGGWVYVPLVEVRHDIAALRTSILAVEEKGDMND